jgi:DNA replication protein DnaC
MRDLMAELKELRLHGMASAWEELASQGEASTASSKWLLEHLLQQEHADRAVRSVNHQMNMAKLPMHRDLAGFDFSASSADARLVRDLSNLEFTDTAQNVVFIGGPGTGKTHLATALAVSGITTHNKRVRFYSTVDLVNLLEREKYDGKAGRIAQGLLRTDLVILDELGYLPFSQSGGALLFHLLSKLYEHTSVVITTNLSFSEWSSVFGDAKMTTALLDRLTHHCHIVETATSPTDCKTAAWPLRRRSSHVNESAKTVSRTMSRFDLHNKYPAACLHAVGLDASSHWDTAAKLIHNCWGKNQQSALGQFSIGRVGQFSISADRQT